MRYFIIINPHSGSARKSKEIADLSISTLRNAGHQVEIHFTNSPKHASHLATEALLRSDIDVIVACGGDGTVNEVGEALKGGATPMGILPNGSGNGLARELHIPLSIHKSLEVLLRNEQICIDTCEANNEPFFTTCGIGFDGQVSELFAHSSKRGIANYVTNSMQSYLDYKGHTFRVKIDGNEEIHHAFLVAVANASQYGNNAFIAPHASLTDNLLDITIIDDFPRIKGGRIAYKLFSGELEQSPYVTLKKGKTIQILSDSPCPYHIDGEPRPPVTELNISIIPNNLKVCIGRDEDTTKNIFDLWNSFTGSFSRLGEQIMRNL